MKKQSCCKVVGGLIGAVVCVCALSMVSVGCRPDFPKCRNSEDCRAEQGNTILLYCCNGQCQECCIDEDCPVDISHCKDYRCVECIEDDDCPDEKPYCENERCVYECEIDADCERRGKAGMICRDHKCEWECEEDLNCPAGMECKNHSCVPACECMTDEDCPAGTICRDCECIEAPKCTLEPTYFEFDQYNLDYTARETLDRNAECLKKRPELTVTIEGHCDERGTTDYNIHLGNRRANAVHRYLRNLGIPDSRLNTISYGEERPVCYEKTEECWARNRRSEFKY